MSEYLDLPRERVHVIHPGLNLKGFGTAPPNAEAGEPPFTIGYFARICPEKGLHVLVDAFRILKQQSPACRLKISGWLGEQNRAYFQSLLDNLRAWGLAGDVEYIETPDHAAKLRFYQSIDVLSVPTTYREPKGLYVLEALASGVPVVQPRHGSFPELIEATGGGLLVRPDDPADLAGALVRLLDNPGERTTLAQRGREAVHARFHAARMADETVSLYRKFLP